MESAPSARKICPKRIPSPWPLRDLYLLPTTLRISREGPLDRNPANFELSGSPGSPDIARARIQAENREAQGQ